MSSRGSVPNFSSDDVINFEELKKTASSELASLGRVSHKLALTESGKPLENVLTLLLPRLLKRIGSNNKRNFSTPKSTSSGLTLKESYNKIHSKLVEMLSHTMKRVRADKNCKLPCGSILDLLYDSSTCLACDPTSIDPFTLNLSLAFLTLGIPRCTKDELESLLPGLLAMVGAHSGIDSYKSISRKNQSSQVAHIFLRSLEAVANGENNTEPHVQRKQKILETQQSQSIEQLGSKPAQDKNDFIKKLHFICSSQPCTSAAVFDLFLDVLLYQPSSSNLNVTADSLPPLGLSQTGFERLAMGSSTTEKNWIVEFLPQSRLGSLKQAILNFIAPCRRWALFLDDFDPNKEQKQLFDETGLGIARTVALLTVACGDSHVDVAEKASNYMKAHMDSRRNMNRDVENRESEIHGHFFQLFGNHISLVASLLSLVIGENICSSLIQKAFGRYDQKSVYSLGIDTGAIGPMTSSDDKRIILSTKRRMVSQIFSSSIMYFISKRIFDEIPDVFKFRMTTKIKEESESNFDDELFNNFSSSAYFLGLLVYRAAEMFIDTSGTTPSSAYVTKRVSARVAAANMLNCFCIRASALCDEISDFYEKRDGASYLNNDHSLSDKSNILNVLSKSLTLASKMVSTSSSPGTGTDTKDSIDLRDYCYGIICTIARSKVGKSDILLNHADPISSRNSFSTAALLFECIANENESLRPRAVAALDAILSAFRQRYCESNLHQEFSVHQPNVSNPWINLSDSEPNHGRVCPVRNSNEITKSSIPMLWNAASPTKPKASRLAAAHWANDFLKPLDHTSGCHILCFLAGDSDVTVSKFSKDSLGIAIDTDFYNDSEKKKETSDFNEIVYNIFYRSTVSSLRPTFFDFSLRSQGAALIFGLSSLLNDLYGAENDSICKYMDALCASLERFSSNVRSNCSLKQDLESMDFLDEASFCLVSCLDISSLIRRKIVSLEFSLTLTNITDFALGASSSKSRKYFSESVGHLIDDFSVWDSSINSESDFDIDVWIGKISMQSEVKICTTRLENIGKDLSLCGEAHGAAYLGSRILRSFRLAYLRSQSMHHCQDSELVKEFLESASKLNVALAEGLLHPDDTISNACASGLSIGFSYIQDDAPLLHKTLFSCTAKALEKLSFALKKFGNGDSTNTSRMPSLVHAAGVLLASSTSGAGSVSHQRDSSTSLGQARLQCVDILFSLLGSSSYRKDPEISISIGEALSEYADAYGPDAIWTSTLGPWPDPYDEVYAADLPPHSQVIYRMLRNEIKYSNPHKRNASAPVLLAIVGHAARMMSKSSQYIKRPLIKEILINILEIQNGFVSLLSDPQIKQLSRESACLGLVACRGLSLVVSTETGTDIKSQELNQRLLKAFGHSKVYGTSALAETRDQFAERMQQEGRQNEPNLATQMTEQFGLGTWEQTEVGGASGIGEAALGAYREMSSAAISLGRPDILYALLVLSVTHPVWTSVSFRDRYNASVFLGKSSVPCGDSIFEIRDTMKPYFPTLVPMLLRACHDPNKQTREQMNSLWAGITGGGALSRLVITDNLLTTIDVLIKDALSKSWRARVGACAALSEVIVGRSWDELGGGESLNPDEAFELNSVKPTFASATRLLQLLRLVTRSLDDVRITVRVSGAKLARSVRSLINQLCNPSSSEESENNIYSTSLRKKTRREKISNSSKAASTTLAWLVKHGLNQPCVEATGFCVSTLLCVVDVSSPLTLQPVIPELIGSLAMAMSGLEPAALNYLQVRAAGADMSSNPSEHSFSYDRLERVRLQLAQSGPIAAALTKCLDMVKSIDRSTQKAIIPHLDTSLRCGAGFATRAAVADAVTSLCSLCPSAFKFDGNSSTNPTVRLLRALYFASERERGIGARDKMAFALGNLAELAPGSSVRTLALRACEKYTHSTGSNDDPAARRAAAAAISAIAVRASSQFSDGGSNDIWNKRVLPLAFIGKYDKDEKVASLWKNVWDEGGQTVMLSEKNKSRFGITLEENLLSFITQICVKSLNDVSWSSRVVACRALFDLANKDILAPAPRALNIYVHDEEFLTRTKMRAKCSMEILSTIVRMIIRNRYWDGKIDLVKAAVKIASLWSSSSVYVTSILSPVSLSFESANDLFRGDRMFEQSTKLQEYTESAEDMEIEDNIKVSTSNENSDIISTEDGALNFDDLERHSNEDLDESGLQTSEHVAQNQIEEGVCSVTIMGFCRALVSQSIHHYTRKSSSLYENDSLLYRAACLQGASEILQTLCSSDETEMTQFSAYKQVMYTTIAKDLVAIIGGNMIDSTTNEMPLKVPPLIIARSINCLSSLFWKNIGDVSEEERVFTSKVLEIFNSNCGGKQSAWTVREAAALGSAELAKFICTEHLRKVRTIETFIDSSVQCLKDKKFWKVRLAGLKILESLCNRVIQKGSKQTEESQMILEALLPYKEEIVKLARRSLSDNESKVTAISSTLCGIISWWP